MNVSQVGNSIKAATIKSEELLGTMHLDTIYTYSTKSFLNN